MGLLKNSCILTSIVSFLNLEKSIKNEFIEDETCSLVRNLFLIMKREKSFLSTLNETDELVVRQLLEYAETHLKYLTCCSSSDSHLIFKELNELLSDKVYLVGNKKTLVDVLFYQFLYPAMTRLTIGDRERYIHLSRWFNYIQQDRQIRQSNSVLQFNRSLLYH